jgi:glycosyltransferase involved in cell wall biosynthesis
MRIAIVTPGGFDRTGIEKTIPVFNWIVERLAASQEVHVFTLYQEPNACVFPLLGATIHNVGRNPGRLSGTRTAWGAVRKILRLHRSAPFEVVHGLWAGETGMAAVVAARLLRIPSIVSVLGAEVANLPEIGYGAQIHWTGRARVRAVVRSADAVFANSRFVARRLGAIRQDVRTIYMGVDLARFPPASAPPTGPPWRLLHVASLNRVKDQPTLLRAMRRIREAEPATTLDIVGEDTLGGAIPRLARDLGFADAVTFHGFQPSPVVAEMMRRSHLLLHSSLHETGPVTLVEAAAAGVPVVGTSVGMIDDLRGQICVGVGVGDAEALASAAIELLRNPSGYADLRQRALAWSAENSVDRTTDEWLSVYNGLISMRAAGRRSASKGRISEARHAD